MTSRSRVELLATPIENALEDLDAAPLSAFFCLGIVNPSGPTLSFVAVVGEMKENAELPIVLVMLNPFAQSVIQVGRFICGTTWNPPVDFQPLLGLAYGDCPTMMLISSAMDEDDRLEVGSRMLESFGDQVVSIYSDVSRFPNDPWSRVSSAMAGASVRLDLPRDESARKLAAIALTPEHFWAEFQAFSYAWNGSIEMTGIPDGMKARAMTEEQFREFFIARLAPSLWIPAAPKQADPIDIPAKPLTLKSFEEVRSTLFSDTWATLSNDDLLVLLRDAMYMYGVEVDEAYVPFLGRLYGYAVSRTDPEHRGMMSMELNGYAEHYKLSIVTFYPILIYEPDKGIASTATINLISVSPYLETGELFAVDRLRHFFQSGSIENPGAVFGALICMGERSLWSFIDELRPNITPDQIRVAATINTPIMQHEAVQYWLRWAKEMVGRGDDKSEMIFGNICSALAGSRRGASGDKIAKSERTFPCYETDQPVRHTQVWTLAEYALFIADDLYDLEARESAPKLMSDVLRAWDLKPRAALVDQYIPPA